MKSSRSRVCNGYARALHANNACCVGKHTYADDAQDSDDQSSDYSEVIRGLLEVYINQHRIDLLRGNWFVAGRCC